jgi:hypothetical protein
MSTIHLHPDVASMEFHMQVQRDNWEETWGARDWVFVEQEDYGVAPD